MQRDDRNARYRILRRLGQGGMAEVFEAELAGDLGFVRKVAIKRMLEAAAADPVAARRFLDEAVIASRLHHANVVSVVDLGLLDERPFQVLEYVDGIDAYRLVTRAGGKLPIEVALAIATAVAHALDHAHSACDPCGLPLGIVHRDVKPSNVLVSWSGDVKLGDFGIAVARDREATTEAGVVAGTAGFIAPEQRARQTLDGRTDVFALGLTLHALATGRSPFAELEVEMRSLAGDPVPIDPALPDDVRAILASALAVDRLARPTAGELAAKLGATLAPRLAGDSRSMLRDFLAAFAPRTAPRAGALDALLGIEVVMTGGSRDELHRYETRAAPPPDPHGDTVVAEPALTKPTVRNRPADDQGAASSLAVTAVQPRRRRAPLVVALLGVGALGGGLALWQLRGSTAPVAPVIDASLELRDAAVVVVHADAPLEPDAPLDATVVATRDANLPVPRDAARAVTRDAAVAVDAAVPVGTGYVQVLGGEELIKASVIIDGRNVGSVPNVFPVSFGAHEIVVEKQDGTRLPARSVEIKEIHNRANPLRARW